MNRPERCRAPVEGSDERSHLPAAFKKTERRIVCVVHQEGTGDAHSAKAMPNATSPAAGTAYVDVFSDMQTGSRATDRRDMWAIVLAVLVIAILVAARESHV
jgi:hypothetical protein